MKTISRVVSMAVLLVFAAVCFARPADSNQPAPTAVIHMTMAKRYSPKVVTVSVGDTVEWVNDDPENLHNITTDKNATDIPQAIQMPQGAKPFNSGMLMRGRNWRYTFTVPGTYRYVCVPHQPEMVGTIIVKPKQ